MVEEFVPAAAAGLAKSGDEYTGRKATPSERKKVVAFELGTLYELAVSSEVMNSLFGVAVYCIAPALDIVERLFRTSLW
ncbi:hypothetical protein [Halorussus salinus]|uniref:hypothetical protein n=1 Tax=Halorussus salinus TaxID=1364935 RepID=UPI0010922256|nr:hypothetical protein [Halorussus salinus]